MSVIWLFLCAWAHAKSKETREEPRVEEEHVKSDDEVVVEDDDFNSKVKLPTRKVRRVGIPEIARQMRARRPADA